MISVSVYDIGSPDAPQEIHTLSDPAWFENTDYATPRADDLPNFTVKIVKGALLQTMKLGLIAPSTVIDLSSIAELKGIAVTGDKVIIGAGTTHAAVAASKDVQARDAGANESHRPMVLAVLAIPSRPRRQEKLRLNDLSPTADGVPQPA
jgi:FAD binding domain in molybdopterin dehydrogenase